MTRPYLAVAVKSFQRSLAYRAANLAGIVTNAFFGVVYVFVYVALFRGRGQVGGLDVRDTITYTILSQSLLAAMSAFGNRDLSEAIIKGEIAADLARPIDFYLYWAAQDLGRAVYYVLFRAIPTFVIGWLLFHPRLPAGPAAAAAFVLAILLGMCISFAFRFCTNSLAFGLNDVRGVHYLTMTTVLFFSGFTVPLNFFPPALRAFTEALPFAAMANLPINLYLGKIGTAAVAVTLLRQALWLLLLALAGRALLARMMRRLTVAGG